MSALVAQALFTAAGLALLERALRGRLDAAVRAAVVALLALGTFALDLALRPGHVAAAASFALAALAVFARERMAGPRRAAVVGAAAGACAALHAPGGALIALAWPGRGEGWRSFLTSLGAAAVCGVAVGLAGLGTPARPGPWDPLLALFASRQGLLALTPALWLGLLGLPLHARRDGRRALPALAALALSVALHAACRTASGGPCPREQLAPVLALLAAPAGEALRWMRARARRAPLAPLWAAGLLLVVRNLLLMQQYAAGMIPRDFPVPFPEVARNGAALLARTAGSPLSWPANWIFAWRHGTSPDRFDAAAGKALPRSSDETVTVDVGRMDVDEALLLEGWSVRHPCGASVCRALESRARALLPVETNGAVSLRVRASGAGRLGVSPLDHGLAASAALGPEPADHCFHSEPGRGLRAFTLSVSPAPGTPTARALVDAITVSPGSCP